MASESMGRAITPYIPARWSAADGIVLEVPHEVLEASTNPAVLDANLSTGIGTDAPIFSPDPRREAMPTATR